MNCWFCYEFVTDYILLPEKNDVFEIPKNKNTYEVKHVEPFVFLYYTVCNHCLIRYLENYPLNFKKIMHREITG